jgi:hypothetical protein
MSNIILCESRLTSYGMRKDALSFLAGISSQESLAIRPLEGMQDDSNNDNQLFSVS